MRTFMFSLIFLFSIIEATWQVKVSFANDPNQRYHMQQFCSDLPPAVCCVPLDVSVDSLGWGWFHAKHLLFNNLPAYNVRLAAYKYRRPRSECDGERVIQHLAIGEALAAYTNNSPEGFSGSLYVPQTSVNGNKTDASHDTPQTASRRTRYPDTIRYMGNTYTNEGANKMIYTSSEGKTITGAPLFSVPTIPHAITAGSPPGLTGSTVTGSLQGLGANSGDDTNITTS